MLIREIREVCFNADTGEIEFENILMSEEYKEDLKESQK